LILESEVKILVPVGFSTKVEFSMEVVMD